MKSTNFYPIIACLIAVLILLSYWPAQAQDGNVYLPFITNGNRQSEAISNGNFENGYAAWAWYPDGSVLSPIYSRSGNYSAMLGNGAVNRLAYIQQQVTVPASQPILVFYRRMDSNDACAPEPFLWDYYLVTVNGMQVFYEQVCSPNSSGNWIREKINLSGFINQSVLLHIQFSSDASLDSWLNVDDISFDTD